MPFSSRETASTSTSLLQIEELLWVAKRAQDQQEVTQHLRDIYSDLSVIQLYDLRSRVDGSFLRSRGNRALLIQAIDNRIQELEASKEDLSFLGSNKVKKLLFGNLRKRDGLAIQRITASLSNQALQAVNKRIKRDFVRSRADRDYLLRYIHAELLQRDLDEQGLKRKEKIKRDEKTKSQLSFIDKIYAETTESDLRISLMEDPVSLLPHAANLDPRLASFTSRSLIFFQENNGFLDDSHPYAKLLQGALDRMKDSTCPDTRVLITADSASRFAQCYADGTIIISLGLIKSLDYLEEVIAVLAHEQTHFERNHHRVHWNEWLLHNESSYRDYGWFRFLQDKMGFLGAERVTESHADLSIPSKLVLIGIDSMFGVQALKKLGGGGAVHGQGGERAHNLVEAHLLIDFETSDICQDEAHPLSREWKLSAEPPLLTRLRLMEYGDEWSELLAETPPSVLQTYLNELVNICSGYIRNWKPYGTKEDKRQERKTVRSNFLKLDQARRLMVERCQEQGYDLEETRRAVQLALSDGIGVRSSHWMSDDLDPSPKNKLRQIRRPLLAANPFDSISAQDYLPESFAQYLELIDGGLYKVLGLPEAEEGDIPSFFSESSAGIITVLDISLQPPGRVKVGQVSIDSVYNYCLLMQQAIQSRWGNDRAEQWFTEMTQKMMRKSLSGVNLINRGRYLRDFLDALSRLSEQGNLQLSSYTKQEIVFHLTPRSVFQDLFPLPDDDYFSHRGLEVIRQAESRVRFVDSDFIDTLSGKKNEKLRAEASDKPESFLINVGNLVAMGQLTSEQRDYLQTFLLSEPMLFGAPNSALRREWLDDELEKRLGFDLPNISESQNQLYLKLRFGIELICIVSTSLSLNDRLELLEKYLRNDSVKTSLELLPPTLLDSLCRFVSSETGQILVNKSGDGYVERKHRLSNTLEKDLVNDGGGVSVEGPRSKKVMVYGDKVVGLPIYEVYRDKLLEVVGTERVSPQSSTRIPRLSAIHEQMRTIYGDLYVTRGEGFFAPSSVSSSHLTPIINMLLDALESGLDDIASNPDELVVLFRYFREKMPRGAEKQMVLNGMARYIVRELDFDMVLSFLSTEVKEGSVEWAIVKEFINARLNTPDQFRQCSTSLSGMVDDLLDQPKAGIGVAALADSLFSDWQRVAGGANIDFLFDSLETSTDAQGIRLRLVEAWWNMYSLWSGVQADYVFRDLQTVVTDQRIEIVGIDASNFYSYSDTDSFLFSLSAKEKLFLLRKLLLSEGGLLELVDERSYDHENASREAIDAERAKLVRLLTTASSADDDRDISALMEKVLMSSLETVDPLLLFNPLANVLLRRFLARPSSEDQAVSQPILSRCLSLARKERKTWEARGIEWDSELMVSLLSLGREQIKKTYLNSHPVLGEIDRRCKDLIDKTKVVLDLGEVETSSGSEFEAASSIEVIMQVAQAMGPVGVRFLQVLGQYVELGESYKERFMDAYDSMPGQSKYTAFMTLERLARTDSEVAHYYNNELVSIDSKLGGGSIYTTFLVTCKNAQGDNYQEVLKVKNPNAERWVREVVTQARGVIVHLLKNDRKNAANYRMASRLLDMIEIWVVEDIKDKRYYDNDQLFAREHHGWIANNGARINVEAARKPCNSWLRREALANGKTVNALMRSPDDGEKDPAKKAVKAEIEFFSRQLDTEIISPDGEKRRLVHSDIHSGNLLVHQENDEIILSPIDRGYYLELSNADVALVKKMLGSKDKEELLQELVTYCLALPENKDLDIKAKWFVRKIKLSFFRDVIKEAFNGGGKSRLQQINSFLQIFDRHGVVVPLRIRIMLKNLDALNKMAKDTGLGELTGV